MIARVLLLVFLAGCKREDSKPQVTSVAVPSSTAAIPSASASASAPSSSASSKKADDATVRAVVAEWNDAINTKNEATLKKLYSKSVTYYGTVLDGAECTKRIMTALAKDPSYHQDISVQSTSIGVHSAVSFKKTFGRTTVDAYITIDTATRVIVLESDKTTDANLAKTKKCLTYGPITIKGSVGHVKGLDEEWWTLDPAVPCIVKGDFEEYAAPRLDDAILELHSPDLATLKASASGYTITGTLVPRGKHQEASIEIQTIKPL